MSTSAWHEFLPLVDDEETTQADVLEATKKFFLEVGLATPRQADGCTVQNLEKLDKWPTNPAVQAFVARAVRTLASVKLANEASRLTQKAIEPSMQSALGLASQLAPPKRVDTEQLLRDANLASLPFVLQLEQPLIDRLDEETKAAKSASRIAFSFVDLTSPQVTPPWLLPEAVGAKYKPGDENEINLQGSDEVATLAKLGQALRGATENHRFFRSYSQWAPCWWRVVPFQVALGQLTWPQAIMHANTVAQIAEEERMQGKPPFTAFLYEELLRKQLEKRASRGDPTLDLNESLLHVDKPLMEVAKQRLSSVLRAASIPTAGGSVPGPGSLRAQAESAAAALAGQQTDRMEAAEAAFHQPTYSKGGKGGGGKGGKKGQKGKAPKGAPSGRAAKKRDWYFDKLENVRDERQQKKWNRWNSNY